LIKETLFMDLLVLKQTPDHTDNQFCSVSHVVLKEPLHDAQQIHHMHVYFTVP